MSDRASWLEGNDRFLGAGVAWVRLLLEERSGPPAQDSVPRAPTQAPAPISQAQTPWYRRVMRQKTRPHAVEEKPTELLLPAAAPQTSLAVRIAQAREVMEGAAALEPPPRLLQLARALGLTAFERKVLLLCAAFELDTRVPLLCAAAQGTASRTYPTLALALTLFDDAAWEVLSPERPLRYWRLVDLDRAGAQPITAAPLRLDERILNHLKGLDHVDDRLMPLFEPPATVDGAPLAPSQQGLVERLVRGVREAAGRTSVVALFGPEAAAKRRVAIEVARRLELHVFQISAALLPRQINELEALVRLWQRETMLLSLALLVEISETDEAADAHLSEVQRLFARSPALTFLSLRSRRSRPSDLHLSVDVEKPTPDEQRQAWSQVLGDGADEAAAAQLSQQFNLDLVAIAALAAEERRSGEDPAGRGRQLWQACRVRLRARLDHLAQRITARARWQDLVLAPAETETLHHITAQVRQRAQVYSTWGFAAKTSRGLGISALFVGPTGTGKTMAAEVIATELDLDLYRIDLAGVVSKYIGETEKNLGRLFDAAEDSGAILFFDEADALFGKRSEVKDSHDRYANIEIDYLLQRLESYRGLAILATNFKGALDNAFLRRLRFIVSFSHPGLPERREIWKRAFPAETELGALDHERLARLNLTGGLIFNVALNAAFLAAEAGTAVTMRLIMDAARAELRKLDRPVKDSEFRLGEGAGNGAGAIA